MNRQEIGTRISYAHIMAKTMAWYLLTAITSILAIVGLFADPVGNRLGVACIILAQMVFVGVLLKSRQAWYERWTFAVNRYQAAANRCVDLRLQMDGLTRRLRDFTGQDQDH